MEKRELNSKYKKVANKIREARKKQGLSQKKLGDSIGVSDMTIWNIENSQITGTYLKNILMIFHVLDIEMDLKTKEKTDAE